MAATSDANMEILLRTDGKSLLCTSKMFAQFANNSEFWRLKLGHHMNHNLPTSNQHDYKSMYNMLLPKGNSKLTDYDMLEISAVNGYEILVRLLVERSADLDCEDALTDAVRCGHAAIVEYLIYKVSPRPKLLIIEAVSHGHADIIRCLVNHGVCYDDVTKTEALYAALDEGMVTTLAYLINDGADFDNRVTKRKMWSKFIKDNNLGVIKYVLENKDRFNIRGIPHINILIENASKYGQLDLIDYLIKGGSKHERTTKNTTCLFAAAKYGQLEVIRHFVEIGLNIRNRKKQTCLYAAIKSGYLDVVQFLIENGAMINIEDVNGTTPISLALKKRRFDIHNYFSSHVD